eukprot:SAG22_NODE_495_length_9802_cov_111.077605_10_plen_65_part_00
MFVRPLLTGMSVASSILSSWQTYQPVTQLWLYKYYGDRQTMAVSYEQTYAFVQMLEASAAHPIP